MGYYEDLCSLLRPLGIYSQEPGPGMAELYALGRSLDGVYEALESALREAVVATAEDGGLAAWEGLLPFSPGESSAALRREAVAALLRVDGGSFTTAAINDTMAGCGINAVVSEAEAPETLLISLTRPRGIPEDFPAIRQRVEQIVPCHLEVEYSFIYTLWRELDSFALSWDAAAAMSWKLMEIYTGE